MARLSWAATDVCPLEPVDKLRGRHAQPAPNRTHDPNRRIVEMDVLADPKRLSQLHLTILD